MPLGHKKNGGGEGLFDAGLEADQIAEAEALAALKPLLEDKSVLKVAQNMKYDWLVFAQRGIEIQAYDDTMLISYVLDAGKGGHGMDDLAKRWLDHDTIHFHHVAGSGKSQVSFDCVAIDKATDYAAEDADVTLRLWHALKARLAAERVTSVYETLERAMPQVLARMERRLPSTARCSLGSRARIRAEAALEDEIKELAGEPLDPGSPKQLGDILFGKMRACPRRHQDQDRAVVDRRARTGEAWPSRATSCRKKETSTGGRSPSCARPIPRRCPITSTQPRTACTPRACIDRPLIV